MASGIEIATAYLSLIPSMKGATEAITQQVQPAAQSAGASAGSSLGAELLGGIKKFAAPVAAAVGVLSIGKLVKSSQDEFNSYAGAVKGFGRIVGGTTEQFSTLRGAMQMGGVDVDAASGSLTIFSKNLGNVAGDSKKAAAMAEKLGVDFLDAQGNVKPMSDILPGLADKFKGMADGAEKNALATQLFGRSGTQMLPFLNQGSEGIAKLNKQAQTMGLVLDDTSFKIMGASKSSAREYNTSIQGMKIALGQTLLPVFTAFTNLGRSFMIPVFQELAHVFSAGRGPALALGAGIQKAADWSRLAMQGLIDLVVKGDFSKAFAKAFHVDEDSGIVNFILTIREGIVGAFSHIRAAVGGGGGIFHALAGAAAPLGAAFGGIFQALGPLLPSFLTLFSALSPVQLLFHALLPVLPQLAGLVAQLAGTLAGALAGALAAIVPMIGPVVQVFAAGLSTALRALVPVIAQVLPLLGGLLAGLAPMFAQLIAALMPLIGAILPPLVQMFTALLPPIVELAASILPLVVPIAGIVVQVLGALARLLMAILIPAIQALLPVVQVVFSVVANIIQAVVNVLISIIRFWVAVFTGDWQGAWGAAIQYFAAIGNALWSVVSGVFQIVGSIIGGALNAIGGMIGGILGWIGATFAGAWNGIVDGAAGMVGGLLGWLGSLPGQIMGFFGGVGGWLVGAGQSLIQGFIDGIRGMVGAIGDAVSGVLDFAKQFFPHSPAKRGPLSGSGYTDTSGKALVRDFARGIASGQNAVAEAAAGVVGAANLAGGQLGAPGAAGPADGRTGAVIHVHESSNPYATAVNIQRLAGSLIG